MVHHTGASNSEQWHVPEMNTAQSQLQNFPSNSPTAWWKDKLSLLFQVFTGRSSSVVDDAMRTNVARGAGTASAGARGEVRGLSVKS